MPHPFRVFLRNGWEANEIPVYTICENSLAQRFSAGKVASGSHSALEGRRSTSIESQRQSSAKLLRQLANSPRREARQPAKSLTDRILYPLNAPFRRNVNSSSRLSTQHTRSGAKRCFSHQDIVHANVLHNPVSPLFKHLSSMYSARPEGNFREEKSCCKLRFV